ncbi:MAG: hypothetical protein IJ784_03070 [Ruminiclostridium sp.]|nr:hypothetical protein [Ruminiclostridium sp.]
MAGFGIAALGLTAAIVLKYMPILIIIAVIGSAGLVLLPIALIRRTNAGREGRIIPKKMYVMSLTFIALPQAVITVFLWVYAIFLLNQYTG